MESKSEPKQARGREWCSEWHPIETAPLDGTWILGMNDRGNCAVIIRSMNAMRRRSYNGEAHDQFSIGEGWIMPFTFGEVSTFWEDARVKWWIPLPPTQDTPNA